MGFVPIEEKITKWEGRDQLRRGTQLTLKEFASLALVYVFSCGS